MKNIFKKIYLILLEKLMKNKKKSFYQKPNFKIIKKNLVKLLNNIKKNYLNNYQNN